MINHYLSATKLPAFTELVETFLLLPYKMLIMPVLMKKFDELVFLSNKVDGDRQWDYRYALKKIHIIPNGIPDIDENLNVSDICILFRKKINNAKILLNVKNQRVASCDRSLE
jgi:hypothetical protein